MGGLNDSKNSIKNPFSLLSDNFKTRPDQYAGMGGQFSAFSLFLGEEVSFFYGVSYILNEKTLIKFERDSVANSIVIDYPVASSDYSIGIDYSFNDRFSIGFSYERGAYSSLKFIYKNNPKVSTKKYKYKKAPTNEWDNQYSKLIKNLEENGIGVNKITETASSIGLELTQFVILILT